MLRKLKKKAKKTFLLTHKAHCVERYRSKTSNMRVTVLIDRVLESGYTEKRYIIAKRYLHSIHEFTKEHEEFFL